MSDTEAQFQTSSQQASGQEHNTMQERDVAREQHLTDQLLFQESVLQHVQDCIIVTDLQGTISYWNNGATQIFGYQAEEMLGKTPGLLYPDMDVQQFAIDLQQILAGHDYSSTWKGRRKDGSPVWVDIKTTVLRNAQGDVTGFIGVSHDITRSKLAEEQLQEGENRFRILADTAPVLIWMSDTNKQCIYFNKVWLDFTGRTVEQERGYGWAEGVHPDDYTSWVEQYVASFDLRQAFVMEYRLQRFDGLYRWILDTGMPRFAPDGTFLGYIGSCIDITERREFEKGKDAFIALVSHELRTPLTSLKGFTQILQRRFKPRNDEQALHFLDKMDRQLNKFSLLINDLLEIAKLQTGNLPLHKADFDLTILIRDVVENIQPITLTHKFQIENTSEAPVHGDRDRIEQVIMNLLNNAIKYSPQADKVTIHVTTDQDSVTVSIQDYGIGIEEAHQQKIFERFYHIPDPMESTFPGLGIGLYISREVIQRHNGDVWVKSTRGEGSTFNFTLPLQKTPSDKK